MSGRGIRKFSGLQKQLSFGSYFPGMKWLNQGAFKAQGYTWETRSSGDTRIGYWRKVLHSKNRKKHYPKRFVFIPGFGDSPLSWCTTLILLYPVLKLEFDEIVLLEFPGFGGVLTQEKAFPNVDLLLSSTCDTLDSLKPHTLMGHSLGGWISAYYASHCGAKLRPKSNQLSYGGPEKLILFCPSGIFPDETAKVEFEAIFRRTHDRGLEALRPYLFSKEPFWFNWILPFIDDFLLRDDIISFLNSFRDEHTLDELAGKIQCGVWLIWGDQDALVPPSCLPKWQKVLNSLANRNPAILLKNIGHSPQLESATITAALISQLILGQTPHALGNRWWKLRNSNPH
jgi:pimeloyl-ACP methyl ester carboxylesterase